MAKKIPLNMRVEPEQRDLLDMAASLLNKDRTAFILEVACREAQNVLLDQRIYLLNEAAFGKFNEILDVPAPNTEALKALLHKPVPWD